MNEKMVPLEIPPGVVQNGTMYQRRGRWVNGQYVRFVNGQPRAIGTPLTLSFTPSAPNGTLRPLGALAWAGGGGQNVIYGTNLGATTKIYNLVNVGTGGTASVNDVTPVASLGGPFSFDVLGDKVVFCGSATVPYSTDGLTTAVTTGGPGSSIGVVVTPERFLVSLQARKIQWASQNTLTTWTPTSANTAGSLDLLAVGDMMTARVVRGRTLIWTTQELFGLNYVGAPLYYGYSLLDRGCGLISSRAVAVVDNATAFWMTERGFKMFDGYVQPVMCDVEDAIFNDFNGSIRDRVFAIVNHPYNEVWWFYPSAAATSTTGPDRMVIYNYRDKLWSAPCAMQRSAGASAGVWNGTDINSWGATAPVLFNQDGSAIYVQDAPGAFNGAYIESGPIFLDDAGNKKIRLQKVVPDNEQTVAGEAITIFSGEWPKGAEDSDILSISTVGGEIDVRRTARYIRYKQALTRSDSRVGTPRIGILPDATR